jgi:hypothetical protein
VIISGQRRGSTVLREETWAASYQGAVSPRTHAPGARAADTRGGGAQAAGTDQSAGEKVHRGQGGSTPGEQSLQQVVVLLYIVEK